MAKYFFKRLISLSPMLLVVSLIRFVGLKVLPGDPMTRTISPDAYANMSPAQLEDLRESLGLNDPMPVQYLRWMGNMLQGDFGYSQVNGSSIAQMLAQRLPATLELAGLGLIVATIFGLALGFLAAVKQNSLFDYASSFVGMIGVSVPEFFLGMVAILIFAIQLKWLPPGGSCALREAPCWMC